MAAPNFESQPDKTDRLPYDLTFGNVSIDKDSRMASINITWKGHDIKVFATYNSPEIDERQAISDIKSALINLDTIVRMHPDKPCTFKMTNFTAEKASNAKVLELKLELFPKKTTAAEPLSSYFKNISYPEIFARLLSQPAGSYLIRDNPLNPEEKIISYVNSENGISHLIIQQDKQNPKKLLVGPLHDVFRDIKDIFADPKYRNLLINPINPSTPFPRPTPMERIGKGMIKNIPSKGEFHSENEIKEKLNLQPDGTFTIVCTENNEGFIDGPITILCKVRGEVKTITLELSSKRPGSFDVKELAIRNKTLEEIFSLPQTQQLAQFPYNLSMEPDVVLSQLTDASNKARQIYEKTLFGTFKSDRARSSIAQNVLMNKKPGSFFIFKEPGEANSMQHVIAYVDSTGKIQKLTCELIGTKYHLKGKTYDSIPGILQDSLFKEILKYPVEAPLIKTARGFKFPLLDTPSTPEAIEQLSPRSLIAFAPYNLNIPTEMLIEEADKIREKLSQEADTNPSLCGLLHKLYETAALLYLQDGDVEKCFNMRALAAEAMVFPSTHPLQRMNEAIAAGTKMQPNAAFGAHFSEMDSGNLKGGNLRAWSRVIDNKPVNRFEFKVSKHTRNDMQYTINLIKDNRQAFEASLPSMLRGREMTITEIPYTFACKTTSGSDTTINGYSPADARAIQIQIEGIGKVTIGNDKKYGCMINSVIVDLQSDFKDGEGLKALHQLLTILGCGPILSPRSKEDDDRIKLAQIYRAFCPREAIQMEQSREFYEWPLDALRGIIELSVPRMKDIFRKYLEDKPDLMKKLEIYPGRSVWCISDLADQMRVHGAYGLMRGAGSKNIEAGIEAVIDLLRHGELSSQDRFLNGKIKMGTSSQEDLASGGGDQVFGRLINHSLVNRDIEKFNFHGHVQVLMDLDVVNRGAYAFFADQFGTKHFNDIQYHSYENRANLIEFAQHVTTECNNEVMIKNRVGPEYIKGLVVATEEHKAKLIAALRKEGLVKSTESGETVNGYPIEKFVYVATKFTKTMWNKE